MNVKLAVSLAAALALALIFPTSANAQKKKKVAPRGMLESMQSVPCGAKQRGLAGLGTLWASVGVTHVNSNEKLCQQYLVRTDDMDYEIRPKDSKHPDVLPLGQEIVFKIKHDHMDLKLADGGKTKSYIIVAMQQASGSSNSETQSAARRSSDRPAEKP